MSCKYVLWHPPLTGKDVCCGYLLEWVIYQLLIGTGCLCECLAEFPNYASAHENEDKVQMDKNNKYVTIGVFKRTGAVYTVAYWSTYEEYSKTRRLFFLECC